MPELLQLNIYNKTFTTESFVGEFPHNCAMGLLYIYFSRLKVSSPLAFLRRTKVLRVASLKERTRREKNCFVKCTLSPRNASTVALMCAPLSMNPFVSCALPNQYETCD